MLELKDLKKHYSMGDAVVRALDGVDLAIKKNEFVAVMGASGSGKSTLMNIIGCLDTPTEGFYSLNGLEVSNLTDDELAKIRNVNLGFIFQTFNLLPRATAVKNVSLPLQYSQNDSVDKYKKAAEMMESVGLGHRLKHKPSELSGGERQRVAIARALINNPNIILAYGRTGNLDSSTAKEIMALIADLHQQGQTIIMVTHEQNIAAYANRIISLMDGRIINDVNKS